MHADMLCIRMVLYRSFEDKLAPILSLGFEIWLKDIGDDIKDYVFHLPDVYCEVEKKKGE